MKLVPSLMIIAMSAPLMAVAKEEKISIDKVPAPAAAAIRAAADKAEVKVEKEEENGAVVYEGKWKVGKKEHEVAVSADGTVVSIEEEIDLAEAPAPVQAAIKALGDELEEVTKVKEKDVVSYEASVETKEGELEVKFDAAGKETGRKVEKEEDDDDDKAEHKDDDDHDEKGEHEDDDDHEEKGEH